MTIEAKAKTKDFGSEAKTKAKDLSFEAKADNCQPRGASRSRPRSRGLHLCHEHLLKRKGAFAVQAPWILIHINIKRYLHYLLASDAVRVDCRLRVLLWLQCVTTCAKSVGFQVRAVACSAGPQCSANTKPVQQRPCLVEDPLTACTDGN